MLKFLKQCQDRDVETARRRTAIAALDKVGEQIEYELNIEADNTQVGVASSRDGQGLEVTFYSLDAAQARELARAGIEILTRKRLESVPHP